MKTVVVADNDAFQRQLIEMLLAVDNYHIVGFETGRQVLEYLQSNVPDIVIFDYSLPDINGADLCAKMHGVKRLSKVPVILVTSTHKLSLVKGIATAVKANAVLAKPLGDKKLREQVQALISPSVSKEVLANATPLAMDPILEQALDHLPHLTQSHENMSVSVPALPEEDFNLDQPLPPMDITDLIDTTSLNDYSPPLTYKEASTSFLDSSTSSPFDYETTGSISEQELLESLQGRIDESASKIPPGNYEPETYRLPDLNTADFELIPPSVTPPHHLKLEVDLLKQQVEQLSSENEQLKTTIRELDHGHPLHASHSYLNAVEELEMLRRLTGIQSKQLNELQNHNQSLLDEIELLKNQRRGGFFGFRSKKASSENV